MKRVEALDLGRVMAMLAVIAIHVSSTYIYSPSSHTLLGMNLAFWLNQLGRFSVPLFLLISGISLGLSTREESVLSFWGRRLKKIGIPYLVWTVIYQLQSVGFDPVKFVGQIGKNPGGFLRVVLLGQAGSHMYFVIILLQCYALYPLIRKAVSRWPAASVGVAFGVTRLVQALYVLKRSGMDLIPKEILPYLWMLFPTWAFYFVLGCALNRDVLERVDALCRKHTGTVLFCTAVYGCLIAAEGKATQVLDSIRSCLNFYVILVLLASFALWGLLERWDSVRKGISVLSKYSMSVYFDHVLVLTWLRRFQVFRSGTRGMILLCLAVTVLSIAVSICVDEGAALALRKLRKKE